MPGLDEFHTEPSYAESVRVYNRRRNGAMRVAWHDYHVEAAGRLRATLEALIQHHEAAAAKLSAEAEAEHISLTSRARAPAHEEDGMCVSPDLTAPEDAEG